MDLFYEILERDAAGRILAANSIGSDKDWTYAYNHLDWLTGANNAGATVTDFDETIVYLANGSLQRHLKPSANDINFTYGAGTGTRPHAPITVNGLAIDYDANGNMVGDGSRGARLGRGQPADPDDAWLGHHHLRLWPGRVAGEEDRRL